MTSVSRAARREIHLGITNSREFPQNPCQLTSYLPNGSIAFLYDPSFGNPGFKESTFAEDPYIAQDKA